MKTVLLGMVLFLVTAIIWGVFNLGIFKSVMFETATAPSPIRYNLFTVARTGAYHKINETLIDLEKWAAENNLNCTETFGLFYDDPDFIEEARLRSDAGCLVPTEEINAYTQKLSDPKLLEKHQPRLVSLETDTAMVVKAQFTGSPWLGPYKVYAAAKNRFADLQTPFQFPVLEIYKIHEQPPKTEYLFFLKQPTILVRESR